jgi:hypothetical protein
VFPTHTAVPVPAAAASSTSFRAQGKVSRKDPHYLDNKKLTRSLLFNARDTQPERKTGFSISSSGVRAQTRLNGIKQSDASK